MAILNVMAMAILGRPHFRSTTPPARVMHHDVMAFTFKVLRTFNRPLLRLIWEAVLIHGTEATFIMNSRAEWHQPAIDRVVITREPPTSQGGAGGAGGAGGRTRGR